MYNKKNRLSILRDQCGLEMLKEKLVSKPEQEVSDNTEENILLVFPVVYCNLHRPLHEAQIIDPLRGLGLQRRTGLVILTQSTVERLL